MAGPGSGHQQRLTWSLPCARLARLLLALSLVAMGMAHRPSQERASPPQFLQPPNADRVGVADQGSFTSLLETAVKKNFIQKLLVPQPSRYVQEGGPGSMTVRNQMLVAIIVGSIFGFLFVVCILIVCFRTFCPDFCADCCGTEDPCVRFCTGKRKGSQQLL